jgi:hypothetical protein
VLALVPGAHAGESAAKFPDACTDEPTACPKALIEVASTPGLSPEDRDLSFGATLRVRPDETSTGSNVLQKGFSTSKRGQYKLQLDDPEGRPSCVLVGEGSDAAHEAVSQLSIADDAWHDVVCRRDGPALSITVDGQRTGIATLPADMWISNDDPIRIGAKNLKADNDQFFGSVLAVFVDIAAPES